MLAYYALPWAEGEQAVLAFAPEGPDGGVNHANDFHAFGTAAVRANLDTLPEFSVPDFSLSDQKPEPAEGPADDVDLFAGGPIPETVDPPSSAGGLAGESLFGPPAGANSEAVDLFSMAEAAEEAPAEEIDKPTWDMELAGELRQAGAADWYKLNVSDLSGRRHLVAAAWPDAGSHVVPVLGVYTAAGKPVRFRVVAADGKAVAVRAVDLPPSKTLYLKVTDGFGQAGPYRLAVNLRG